jgi:ATP-binding cassette subfamily B protein
VRRAAHGEDHDDHHHTALSAPTGQRFAPPPATISPDRSASWLNRARPLVKAHRWMFGTAVVTAFVALVVQVQIPAAIGRAIDGALDPQAGGGNAVSRSVILIAALGLGRWALNTVSRTLLLRTAYRIEYDLRNLIYEHLLRLPFSFFDRVASGELMSRASSDIRSVQMYLATAPVVLAQCAVAVIVFVEMLTVNVILAVVAMATMPVVAIVGIRMRRQLFPVSWLVQARLADVATVVDENINGVRVVKSFAAEEAQLHALVRAAQRARWTVVRDAAVRARWSPVLENLPRLGQALILLVGGWMATSGRVSVGTIVAFNAYVLLLQPPFRMLGMIMMMGQRARASAQRIYAILDEAPTIVDRPGAPALPRGRGEVCFEGVDFAYRPGAPVLSGLDLRVHPGELVAVVGRSGSGKSTMARLLARFYDVDGGAVTVDGHDVRAVTMASLRGQVAMALEEPFLFSVPVRDNIAYGRPDANGAQIEAAARAAGAHGFITALADGYDTVVGERGYTLSGGQRQRIALARALLADPPILVLDDATSAIDAALEAQILQWMRDEMPGRTTIIVAHRASSLRLADRVVMIDGGRVVAEGRHDELLERAPGYAALLVGDGREEDDARDEVGEDGERVSA